jgi:hypothetical protein
MNTEDKLFCHNDRPETIKPTIESITAERDNLKAERDELIKLYELFADIGNNNYCVSATILRDIYSAVERIKEADK